MSVTVGKSACNTAGIAKTVFTPVERAELALADDERKIGLFFSLWTMKEARIKALGTGCSLNPSRFEIPTAPPPRLVEAAALPDAPYPMGVDPSGVRRDDQGRCGTSP